MPEFKKLTIKRIDEIEKALLSMVEDEENKEEVKRLCIMARNSADSYA